MNAREIHEACHSAASECPQHHYDSADEYGCGIGSDYAKTVRYWLQEGLLWDKGYHVFLPAAVVAEFNKADPLRARHRTVVIEIGG